MMEPGIDLKLDKGIGLRSLHLKRRGVLRGIGDPISRDGMGKRINTLRIQTQ